MSTLKNDIAWQQIEDKYHFVDQIKAEGIFKITASQIKEYREPRLMTKFDHLNQLPQIFRDNNLSILPDKRGSYLIGRFDTFESVEDGFTEKIRHFEKPSFIASIDSGAGTRITSEAVALNAAFSSGIISDFLEEELLFPTISGRQSSGAFEYAIISLDGNPINISVENAQIEIDAGYESPDCLTLVEAKLHLSDDFMLRQLYYPFRTWSQILDKRIRLVYLVYANRTFFLCEYCFDDQHIYNSARLIKKARYSIESTRISFDEIIEVHSKAKIKPEPQTPFPQADSMERVINLCERLDFRAYESSEIYEAYDFTSRQADYYGKAAEYLGLVKKSATSTWDLDNDGISFLGLDFHDGRLFICEKLFEHRPFYEAFKILCESGEIPSKRCAAELIRQHTNCKSVTTSERRASTLRGWLKWVCALAEED